MRHGVPILALVALVATACSETSPAPTATPTEPLAPVISAAAAISVTPSVTGATVDTDKDDYAPGETVIITGAGWAAGESIHLNLTEDPVADGPHDWDVVADQSGGFSDASFSPGMQHLGVMFTLTATGAVSGTSVAIFKDALQTTTVLTLNPASTTAGTTVMATATVTIDNTSGPATGGTVSFYHGGTNCAGGAGEEIAANVAVNGSGVATTSFAATVSETIRACFSGTGGGSTGLQASNGTRALGVTTPVDVTKPVISYTLTPASPNGNNGWYVSDVTVTFTCTDEVGGSGLATNTVAGTTLTTDGASQSVTNTGTCIDNAGNTADAVTVSGINIDKTAPTISGSASPAANGNGWNNLAVTVSYSCSDATSGVASCGPNETLTSEGASQSSTGTATDNAGNSNTTTVSGINIDLTAPTVAVTGVANGGVYILGQVPTAGCSTSDALSGVATAASLSSTGGPLGFVTATCSGAVDNAGNAGSASATYQVVYDWDGFFRPIDNDVFNVAKAGSAIPAKFSLAGYQGMSIFVAGYPKSVPIACAAGASLEAVDETVTAGNSSLNYDATVDQYIYVWKTEKSWANTCRRFQVMLIDGTMHTADFKFSK